MLFGVRVFWNSREHQDRTNEVREERWVEPNEGRSFEEVIRFWVLSVLSTLR